MLTKISLRKSVRIKFAAIPAARRLAKSRKLFRRLCQDPVFRLAEHVAFFHGTASEVTTRLFFAGMLKSKKIYLPRTCPVRKNITFRRVRVPLKDLVRGAYGIMEPRVACAKRPAERMDLIITPGVAFDKHGARLGRGGGYYDRLLKKAKNVPKIGICFREQLVKKVPVKPHDVRVDRVITD